MFKVIVTNPNKSGSPFSASFSTLEEAQAWISLCSNKVSQPWGKPEHQKEILGEDGLPLDPPQFQFVQSEFTVDITDVSAQVNQEKVNAEALAYLASTDWYCIRFLEAGNVVPAEILEARAAARARIVR